MDGKLSFHDLISDKFDEIEDCHSYQQIDDNENKELILNKVALDSIAQDQVYLIKMIVKMKEAAQAR